MKIHIYYRHVPSGRSAGKLRPAWFSHERCLANLIETMEAGLAAGHVVLTVVFDGSAEAHAADFSSTHLERLQGRFGPAAARVRFVQGGDQRKAWRACVGLVRDDCDGIIQPGDLVYLLENDYLHLPGWLDEVRTLSDAGVAWEYLTLYDHPDKYPNACAHPDAQRHRGLQSRVFATRQRHWRTAPSTCATYMLSRETFLKDFPLLRLGIYDLRLFKLLTRLRRRVLVSPMPALATHCMSDLLAPVVDWAGVADNVALAAPAARP